MNEEREYFLQTERLGFRTWGEDDIALAVGLWGDPEVTRLIDARGALSPEQVRQRLSDEIASQRQHGVQYWPIFLLGAGEHVGCCGLRRREPTEGMFELGVHLRPAHWGRGLAFEAASGAIAHAFSALAATSLFAGHNPKNLDSRRLLQKLGFQWTHDEYYAPTGLQHPSYLLCQR